MLSAKEGLSRIDRAKREDGNEYTSPHFIRIFCNKRGWIHSHDIPNLCPDKIIPMILEHIDIITDICIGKPPTREIGVQLIRDLLEKKPHLEVGLTPDALPWVIYSGFGLRNIRAYYVTEISIPSLGELFCVEGNNVEMLSVVRSSRVTIQDFVSYLQHPNCRVKQVRIVECNVMMNLPMIRNTLIRRVVAFNYDGVDSIVWPYMVGENEFETMLRVLHELRGSLPVDLWRVIFYFL